MYSPHSTTDFSLDSDSTYTQYINLDSNVNTSTNLFPKDMLINVQNMMTTINYEKMIAKNKRILKRENAKKRSQKKQEQEEIKIKEETNANKIELIVKAEDFAIESNVVKNEEENLNNNTNDSFAMSENYWSNEKEKKKAIQKIRNRVSAQQSRDRKKQYLENLEKENARLVSVEIKIFL